MNEKNFCFEFNEFSMNYKIFCPNADESDYKNLPLLVYLHGAGERGKNSEHLFRHGIPKLIKEGLEIPAVVLAPQCPETFVWDNVADKVKAVIDRTALDFSIEKDRVCITGSSMGGFGTWMMGLTYPSFFAGIAPIAGGGMSWRAAKLRTTPIYAIHGKEDKAVPAEYSELMVQAVNACGGNAVLKELDGKGHNDGIDFAYRSTDLIQWLLSQRRNNFDYVPEICEDLF